MWFLTNITSIRIPSGEPFIMFINIRVLRLRSMDWKSSLNTIYYNLQYIQLSAHMPLALGVHEPNLK